MAEDARKVSVEGGAPGAKPELVVQRFSPLPTGTRLGELTIQSVLGAGECGITYIAVHEASNRRFVLKEYLPRSIAFRDGPTVRVSAANSPAFAWGLDRFLSEGRALAKIKHPAVIAVQAVNEANGTGYMVMTHEAGRDLGIWLHELRRTPTEQELDAVLKPLLEGLGVVHGKEILHLDITPSNILIRENGTPVLIDFGSVRVGMRRRLHMSAPAEAKSFMAPEVLASDQNMIGARSDIYALAGVVYLAMTGKAPPQADKRVLRDEYVPVGEACPIKLRPSLQAGLDAALRFRPDDRPQQVGVWQQQLWMLEAVTPPPAKPVAEPIAEVVAAQREPTVSPVKSSPTPTEVRRFYSYSDETDGNSEKGQSGGDVLMDNPGFRTLFFAVLGGVGGALAGALTSIVVASIVSSSCYTDACVMPILPFTAAAGALAGLYLGAQYGKSSGRQAPKPSFQDIDL